MPRQLGSGSRLSGILVFILLLGVVSGSAFGEVNVSHSSAQFTPKRAPESHLYWHFLLYQNHLDRVAAIRDKQGKSGEPLRNHFQQRLHFTDAQFAIVRSEGLRLETELNTVNAKVKPIVAQDREWIKLHGRSAGPPPGHPQVQQLQKEHEAVIGNSVERLNRALGAETATKFQSFIDIEWAPQVTVHTFHPRAHDPKHNPVVPLHMEARP
jgi:hypothetical protein